MRFTSAVSRLPSAWTIALSGWARTRLSWWWSDCTDLQAEIDQIADMW